MSKLQKVTEYFANTSLHGPKYIIEAGRHWIEKVFWILVFIGAIALGVYLTERIFTKWQSTPVLTSISTTNYPLTEIPFPAVTICPNPKGMKGKIIHEICQNEWAYNLNPDQIILELQKAVGPLLGDHYDELNRSDLPSTFASNELATR